MDDRGSTEPEGLGTLRERVSRLEALRIADRERWEADRQRLQAFESEMRAAWQATGAELRALNASLGERFGALDVKLAGDGAVARVRTKWADWARGVIGGSLGWGLVQAALNFLHGKH